MRSELVYTPAYAHHAVRRTTLLFWISDRQPPVSSRRASTGSHPNPPVRHLHSVVGGVTAGQCPSLRLALCCSAAWAHLSSLFHHWTRTVITCLGPRATYSVPVPPLAARERSAFRHCLGFLEVFGAHWPGLRRCTKGGGNPLPKPATLRRGRPVTRVVGTMRPCGAHLKLDAGKREKGGRGRPKGATVFPQLPGFPLSGQ